MSTIEVTCPECASRLEVDSGSEGGRPTAGFCALAVAALLALVLIAFLSWRLRTTARELGLERAARAALYATSFSNSLQLIKTEVALDCAQIDLNCRATRLQIRDDALKEAYRRLERKEK
jgi:hypothetical protein